MQVLKELATEEVCGLAYEHPKVPPTAGKLSDDDQQAINLITQLFREHVDMAALIGKIEQTFSTIGLMLAKTHDLRVLSCFGS